MITRPYTQVSEAEEVIKNAESHCAGFFSSSFFMSCCGINRTYGAAISTSRFMDAATLPVLRWVKLKADATQANEMCVYICVWYGECWQKKSRAPYDGNHCKWAI